ncbi:lesion bypass DNA polymerase [Auricularia subglabra TFB-10046 SS5]|nr:lesion bypass DNA polymerase [Auricularia subglabra TFB-10046 SS5]
MQRKFGEESVWVWEVLRGIDRSEVKEKPVLNKSMLASKNLPRPVTKPSDGIHWLRVLASELALRLQEARETTPGLWPKTIVLHTKQGWQASKSRQAAFPFTRHLSADVVCSAGEKLWREAVGTDASAPKDLKITHLMLGFGGIAALAAGQAGIEGFFAASNTAASTEAEAEVWDKCEKCGAVMRPAHWDALPEDADAETRAAVQVAARAEHEDWHFARELARKPPSSPPPVSASPPKQKRKDSGDVQKPAPGKKRKKEPVGIAKYFSKK